MKEAISVKDADMRAKLRRILNPERWLRTSADGRALNTYFGFARSYFVRTLTAESRRVRRLVERGISLPNLPNSKGATWAISMVRNEQDIIEKSVRHLFEQGIDYVLIIDNRSTDDTLKILTMLSNEYPLYVGTDSENAYYQAHKMSFLAESVRRSGARWIIPFDADEFWYVPGSRISDFLRKQTSTIVRAKMFNAFPIEGADAATGDLPMMRIDTVPSHYSKVAVRSFPALWITQGNHDAKRPGYVGAGLYIVHVPWRSQSQFMGKLRQGAASIGAALGTGLGDAQLNKEVQHNYWLENRDKSDAELDQAWQRLVSGEHVVSLHWSPSMTGSLRPIDLRDESSWPRRI